MDFPNRHWTIRALALVVVIAPASGRAQSARCARLPAGATREAVGRMQSVAERLAGIADSYARVARGGGAVSDELARSAREACLDAGDLRSQLRQYVESEQLDADLAAIDARHYYKLSECERIGSSLDAFKSAPGISASATREASLAFAGVNAELEAAIAHRREKCRREADEARAEQEQARRREAEAARRDQEEAAARTQAEAAAPRAEVGQGGRPGVAAPEERARTSPARPAPTPPATDQAEAQVAAAQRILDSNAQAQQAVQKTTGALVDFFRQSAEAWQRQEEARAARERERRAVLDARNLQAFRYLAKLQAEYRAEPGFETSSENLAANCGYEFNWLHAIESIQRGDGFQFENEEKNEACTVKAYEAMLAYRERIARGRREREGFVRGAFQPVAIYAKARFTAVVAGPKPGVVELGAGEGLVRVQVEPLSRAPLSGPLGVYRKRGDEYLAWEDAPGGKRSLTTGALGKPRTVLLPDVDLRSTSVEVRGEHLYAVVALDAQRERLSLRRRAVAGGDWQVLYEGPLLDYAVVGDSVFVNRGMDLVRLVPAGEPVVAHQARNVPDSGISGLWADDEALYWTEGGVLKVGEGELWAMPAHGGHGGALLHCVSTGRVRTHGGRIFLFETKYLLPEDPPAPNRILMVEPGTGAVTVLVDGLRDASEVLVDDQYVYFASYPKGFLEEDGTGWAVRYR